MMLKTSHVIEQTNDAQNQPGMQVVHIWNVSLVVEIEEEDYIFSNAATR